MDIIVGITGASGSIYGVRILEVLKEKNVKTHLILSKWGEETLKLETDYALPYVEGLASEVYPIDDLSARVSSGSFQTKGMIIAPCSMKTLAAIASGLDLNLMIRAADVTLKEQRKLILLPRETPLNPIHLENMLKLARLGVLILPPIPAFYSRPKTLHDIVDHTVGRILDHFHIKHDLLKRWEGR